MHTLTIVNNSMKLTFRSKDWETRMAASKALTCILKVIPKGCMFKRENDDRYDIPKSSVLESINEKFGENMVYRD